MCFSAAVISWNVTHCIAMSVACFLSMQQGFFVFSGDLSQWNVGDFFPSFEKKILIFKFLFFLLDDLEFFALEFFSHHTYKLH